MTRLIYAIVWMIGLAIIGAALIMSLAFALFHPNLASHEAVMILGFGAECGLVVFILALCFAGLPGLRRPPGVIRPFGLAQGLWGMAGFGLMMAAAGLLLVNILVVENFILMWRHSPNRVSFTGHNFFLTVALAGELAAALWVAWYLRRIGAERVHDRSPSGIGWAKAVRRAYLEAAFYAACIITVVMVLYHLEPPALDKLAASPMERLFSGSSLSLLPILVVALFIGPVLEEFVFRGIGFAGIATRFGPAWAGILTTLAFMGAHAPEKIYYPLGFIDVGLLATASVLLRLRYGSIRPGIVLHVLYNGGAMLASALIG